MLFSFQSCKDDVGDEVIVFLTPSDLQVVADVGDYVGITVKASSSNKLTSLIITETINTKQSVIILDSSLTVKSFSFDYSYLVPEVDKVENNEIKLVFTFVDDLGNTQKRTKLIKVNFSQEELTEITGNEMFSRLASNKNAFNLVSLQPVNYQTTDSAYRFIEDYSLDTVTTEPVDTLSRKWISPAGIKFLKYNSFDYANATHQSIKDSYLSGIETDFIDDLKEGDIILTYIPQADIGHEFYILKIIYIIDNPGVENDKYIFNIKH